MKSTLPYQAILDELKHFSITLTAKFSAKSVGQPEAQLKSPVEQLFSAYSTATSHAIVLKDESAVDRLGRPDYAVESNGLLIGYIELKEPDKGANPEKYKGHDAEQWERFKSIPNILYTSANEWALYQNGKLVDKIVRLHGDACTDGEKAVNADDAQALFALFAAFTSWSPIVPQKPKELASYLAPFCRLVRDDVMDALQDPQSPMHSLKAEIQNLLFPDADDFRFADAYAQTIVFALLLAHLEKANVLDLRNSYDTLEKHHSLLSRSLEFLTDKAAQKEISTSLALVQRVIHATPQEALNTSGDATDPWLFFYENFLAAYDPELRKKAGVYYTPLEVVQCQVRLIDEVLQKQFGKEMGFVEAGVATLDPAVGTGTYLLAIVEHALGRVEKEEGAGAVKGGARSLIHNLHGFEWMVGPYAVAQLRFSQALTRYKVVLPETGTGIYLTNTLESPHVKPPAPPLFHKPIAQEHERALKVKDAQHVLVCLGNPPYGRHESAEKDGSNKETTGGWVRYGDEGEKAILEAFMEPARKAGHGVHLKNLYNLYVYFVRWSLWKVFEHKTAVGPGVVSFITASSYIDGDAFSGMREHMRKVCDRIDIIDLGGEGRGTRKDENVFAIQTPVAIFVAWRKKLKNTDTPAEVRYTKIEGTREEKLESLAKIKTDKGLKWEKAPEGWQEPFRPVSGGVFAQCLLITDLFPWQSNGVQCKRTWPIAHEVAVLEKRWETLLESNNRGEYMKESGDRTIKLKQIDILNFKDELPAIETLENAPPHSIVPYSYRSFDRQFLLADNRLISRPRPQLWYAQSDNQFYFSSMLYTPLGNGPALTTCSGIPDLHHFSNRGAKDVIPLFLNKQANQPNILPGLLNLLGSVSAEDLAGYVYCLLAHPEYTSRFADELVNREVRVPLTKNKKLFAEAAEFGKALIWLHTYGEQLYNSKDRPKSKVPKGAAKNTLAVPDSEEKYPNEYGYDEKTETITVGDGKFAPVAKAVWEFEVSGFKVVQSWLGYRMRERKGKKSSPLDDIHPKSWTYEFTREFLELLWVLEKTLAGYPEQKKLFEKVLESDLFKAAELPPVPEECRQGPKIPKVSKGQTEMWDKE
jgi:hypothetical protein